VIVKTLNVSLFPKSSAFEELLLAALYFISKVERRREKFCGGNLLDLEVSYGVSVFFW